MGFSATIIKDSIFKNGARVTSALLTFPRSILAEFNTHRMFSRNAASSRAMPAKKVILEVERDPFIPIFRKNGKGMQGYEELNADESNLAQIKWLRLRDDAIEIAKYLSEELNIHKQYTNRPLESWMWCTVLVTATDWDNMFAQRCHPAAEPSFNTVANMLYEVFTESTPRERWHGEDRDLGNSLNWHLPFFNYSDEDRHQWEELKYESVYAYLKEALGTNVVYPVERFEKRLWQDIAVGRIAKLSYNNLETGKEDVLNDIRLAVQLSSSVPGHWSPFEHVCREALPNEMVYRLDQLTYNSYSHTIAPKKNELGYCGNLLGATQYRKEFPNENITGEF